MIPMTLFALAGSLSTVAIPDRARIFIEHTLDLAHYRAAPVDLNRDRSPEVLVYANDPSHCGSGGCDLYVLAKTRRGYRVVTTISVARLPVAVLATSSRGWRDLSVRVAGGGITRGYDARIRFDGRRYPGNPTVAPTVPLTERPGRIVLN